MRACILLLALLFIQCNEGPTEQQADKNEAAGESPGGDTSMPGDDTAVIQGTSLLMWIVDHDAGTKRRNPAFKDEYLVADSVIKGLNEEYPDIRLEKVKMKGDTLVTKIADATYLTERMGSSGSASYLADAIINLTAISGVKYLQMDFEEGSHASPGVWTAADVSDFREIQ